MRRALALLVLLLGAWGCADRDTLSGDRVTLEDLTVAVKRRLEADPRVRSVRRGDPGQLFVDLHDDVGHEINLGNLLRRLAADPVERRRQVDEFLANMIVDPDATYPMDPRSLLPVIKDLEFLRQVDAAMGGRDRTVSRPFVGDLVVVYAIDAPTTLAYLTESGLPKLGVPLPELEGVALANFRREKLPLLRFGQNGPLVRLTGDGDYDATFMLLPEVWDAIAEDLGAPPVVAVPARSHVGFVAGGRGFEQDLAGWARELNANESHPMSTLLYEWRGGSWNLLAP